MELAASLRTPKIPHRREMAFLDVVKSYDPESHITEVEVRLSEDKRYYQGGYINHVWLVEIIAQSAAALFHLERARESKEPRPGYLVGIEEVDIIEAIELTPGTLLRIQAAIENEFFPCGYFSFSVKCEEILVACAKMKFIVDDQEELSH